MTISHHISVRGDVPWRAKNMLHGDKRLYSTHTNLVLNVKSYTYMSNLHDG